MTIIRSDNERTPSFYAIIPADVRYCKDLEPAAKLLYGEITALTQREGYCWASNKYFADLYDVCERTVTNWLISLQTCGFIIIETEKEGLKWDRKIWITQKMFTKGKKFPDQNSEYNSKENASTDTFQRKEKNFLIEGKKTSTDVLHNNIKQHVVVVKHPPPGVLCGNVHNSNSGQAKDKRFTLDDAYHACISLKKDWTSEEIEDAWKVFPSDRLDISDPIEYFCAIINKRRILKQYKEEKCQTHKDQMKKEEKKSKMQPKKDSSKKKETLPTEKPMYSESGTEMRRLVDLLPKDWDRIRSTVL